MISLLVPSRGRPGKLAAMWESANATADDPGDLELVVRLDDDDVAYPLLPGNVSYIRGPRIVLSQMWNEAHAAAAGPVFWHGGDDNLFRSEGWDTAVLKAICQFADGLVLVHGRDGFQDARLATHGFITADWVTASGFFVPPYFSADWNDTWLTEVADSLGRRVFLPDVYIEHMHPVAGKAPMDVTYQDANARRDGGAGKYAGLAAERAAHAQRLRDAAGST